MQPYSLDSPSQIPQKASSCLMNIIQTQGLFFKSFQNLLTLHFKIIPATVQLCISPRARRSGPHSLRLSSALSTSSAWWHPTHLWDMAPVPSPRREPLYLLIPTGHWLLLYSVHLKYILAQILFFQRLSYYIMYTGCGRSDTTEWGWQGKWMSHMRWTEIGTIHLKCPMVCMSVILLCYSITILWFCNKRFLCNK